MTAIDKILLKLANDLSSLTIPKRDSKVLRSLANAVDGPAFITENQGKLLIKILTENLENFQDFRDEVFDSIKLPTWSRQFRPVDKTKKMYVQPVNDSNSIITVEFAYNSSIRQTITSNIKKISGLTQSQNSKLYHADLTEKNIVTLVDLLKPLGFEIDGKIQDFYETIKSWSEDEVKSQFELSNISHANFQKEIVDDLGMHTSIDENIIADRSLRYQYFSKKTEKNPENLTEIIANRESTRIWINRKDFTLEEIVSSLKSLKRFPMLVIFDSSDAKQCVEDLKNLHENLEKNEIFDNVGIYFRLDNNETGLQFNKFIADNQYNCQLDETTKVVGVQNGKIPKFFLKSNWKPMSVISIGGNLRQTKTAVYANCCDLVISYTDNKPLIETRTIWE